MVVSVPLPDGRAPVYRITAQQTGRRVTARETIPTRLPRFCPERHINDDATFCLGWAKVDPLEVNTVKDAWKWWATLIKFLRLQERAARTHRWPSTTQGWDHGNAAVHQLRAERSATQLGSPFIEDLQNNRLSIRRVLSGSNGPAIRVLREGKRIYAVWEVRKRAVNLRRRCVCAKCQLSAPSILRNCTEHHQAAIELAFSLRDREREIARFWKSYEGRPCCGTMDNCPLI